MFRLFRKDIEKHCAYCKSGSVISEGQEQRRFDAENILCYVARNDVTSACRGVVDSADHCRHFCYDPLKRVPPRPATLNDKYTSEDFSL